MDRVRSIRLIRLFGYFGRRTKIPTELQKCQDIEISQYWTRGNKCNELCLMRQFENQYQSGYYFKGDIYNRVTQVFRSSASFLLEIIRE